MGIKRLIQIINCYKLKRLPKLNKYLNAYKKRDLKKVVELASLGKQPHDKMHQHRHQRRIKSVVLKHVSKTLLKKVNIKAIGKCKSFDSLYNLIDRYRVSGFADLCVYDTALRIGFSRDLLPEKVYLHRGAETGAKLLKLNITNGYLTMKEFSKLSEAFNRLKPYQIEDLLCVCKKDLKVGRITKSMLIKCRTNNDC